MKKKIVYAIITVAVLLLIVLCAVRCTQNNNKNTDLPANKIQTESNKSSNKVLKTDKSEEQPETETEETNDENIQEQETNIENENPEQTKNKTVSALISSYNIPISAIAEISDMNKSVQDSVMKIAENTNSILMAKKINNKLFVVAENLSNIRHGIDFIEVSPINGHLSTSTLGYNDKIKDSDNDKWEYLQDTEIQLPVKHIKYNSDGDAEFIEEWNYDTNDSLKYQMKTPDGKIITMRKETIDDNNNNLRVEHIVYDKSGNTKISVITSYEGADLKRFTYYNADKPNESASVYSEYDNGLKIKETVLSSSLKVQNSYTADYINGVRTTVTVFDNNNNEVKQISAE